MLKSLDLYKIGRTQSPANRFRVYSTENPHGLTLIACEPVEDCFAFERFLHDWYADRRVVGEWFRLTQKEVEGIIFDMQLEATVPDEGILDGLQL